MLSRLHQWLAKHREWHAEHARVWDSISVPREDGLSAFQDAAAAALCRELPSIKLARAGQNETYLTGPIPGTTATIFIYYAGAEVLGVPDIYSGESEATLDPNELIQDFVATAKRAAAV